MVDQDRLYPKLGVNFHGMWTAYDVAGADPDRDRKIVLAAMRDAGMDSVRLDVSWEMIQPTAHGVFDMSFGVPFVDRIIRLCNSYGIKPLVLFWLTPGWARPGGTDNHHLPTSATNYSDALVWAAQRYRGQVVGWEIWNEEDSTDFMFSTSPANAAVIYSALLINAYNALHPVMPDVPVVFGGVQYVNTDFITACYAAGVAGHFDVMGCHPYMSAADLDPSTPDTGTEWNLEHLGALFTLMKANGEGSKPIWCTEFGWSSHANTGGEAAYAKGVPEPIQGTYLMKTYRLVRALFPTVERMYWYDDRDGDEGSVQNSNYGLLDVNLQPKTVLRYIKALSTIRGASPAWTDYAPAPLDLAKVYNIKDHGALVDGSTDDSAAINALVASVPNGGVIWFPAGITQLTHPINLAGTRNITLAGLGGRTAGGTAASLIRYSGADGTNIIDMRSSLGTQVRDLQILVPVNFTGRIIDIRTTSFNPAYIRLSNLYIGGSTSFRTAIGVDLHNSTRVTIERVAFYSLAVCISGRDDSSGQSNQITVDDCGFNQSAIGIRNPGQAWQVRGGCFEGSYDGTARGITHDTGVVAQGLLIQGAWCGDTTGGTQFKLAGSGITITGNWIGATGGTGIDIDEASNGVEIHGNYFISATSGIILRAESANLAVRIGSNDYLGVTTPLTGYPRGVNNTAYPLAYLTGGEVDTNLVLNPDFATNTASWNVTGSALTNAGATLTRVTDNNSPAGTTVACARIDYTASLNQQGMWQQINGLPATTPLVFTGWIKNVSGRPVKLRLRDVTNAAAGTDSAYVTAGTGWQRVTASITTGASPADVMVAVVSDTATAIGSYYIDDMRFGQRGAAETQIEAILRRALTNAGLVVDQTGV